MLTKEELWNKSGTSEHITREDVGVREPNPNELGQELIEGFFSSTKKPLKVIE